MSSSEISIVKANYFEDYKIELRFNDGTIQVVNFRPFLKASKHPEISKYLDLKLFKTFKIVDGDLDWGDFDLSFPIWDLYTNNITKSADSDSQEAG